MSIIGNAVTFGGGSGEPELLWENHGELRPSSLTVDLPTGYSAYLVQFANHVIVDPCYYSCVVYVPFFESYRDFIAGSSIDGALGWSDVGKRRILSARDGQICFGNASTKDGYSGPAYTAPYRIWGVKWTIQEGR
ncbi:MAG: hypothetical protein IJS55_07155 [Oscillospiraceae bacterium]|nr:hypothetical protein [Oscillospiraceae bacterium]